MRSPLLRAALGEEPPDLAIHRCTLFDPFTCTWTETSFALKEGIVCTMERVHALRVLDLEGARVVPGFIDAHVHIESSLLTPLEFGRLVLPRGVTTVIADPHEIANVLGIRGIRYMLREAEKTPLDIFFMLPSCVPASPLDTGGAHLSPKELRRLRGGERILGIGEVMNVPAVLAGEGGMLETIALMELVDGHAPLLHGRELDAYIASGIQSDHECVSADEAIAKLQRGMHIYMREGSAARNLRALLPIVTHCTAPRISVATDDRDAGMLSEHGSIDDCVREAISLGCEPELALRMATLSPAERFSLRDRGAIAPGRIGDFIVLDEGRELTARRVFKRGREVTRVPRIRPGVVRHRFRASVPRPEDLNIPESGIANVIGLIRGQIVTSRLTLPVAGPELPDTERDILKAVVCNRYREGRTGIGLVQGFGLCNGAIATSISHDAHHVVAAGADDRSIAKALARVVSMDGGMVAVCGSEREELRLECAGLMSVEGHEEVVGDLRALDRMVARMNGIEGAFMYLSFLALTVIPRLRITDAGPFDASAGTLIPLIERHE